MKDRGLREYAFDGVIERGAVRLPEAALRKLGGTEGTAVRVRLAAVRIARALDRRKVQEEEIRRIGEIQREERDTVIRFLLAEGSAAGFGGGRGR